MCVGMTFLLFRLEVYGKLKRTQRFLEDFRAGQMISELDDHGAMGYRPIRLIFNENPCLILKIESLNHGGS